MSLELEVYRISFVHYALHPNQINAFEILFLNNLGFSKYQLGNSSNYVYSNKAAHYVITLTDKIISSSLISVGIHLKSKFNSISKIGNNDIEQYVKSIVQTNSQAKFLRNNVLPFPGIEIGKMVFYFTNDSDFQEDNMFSKSNYKLTLSNDLNLYHHHVAFYFHNDTSSLYLLKKFLQSNLGLELSAFYSVPNSNQKVTAFQKNQVRLNIIESIEAENFNIISREDHYTHAALGTNKILRFFERVYGTAKLTGSSIEIISMSDNSMIKYYQRQENNHSWIPTEEELNFISYSHNPNDLKSFGLQFFFNTVLGLVEGIESRGYFQFMPQAGQNAYRGIQSILTSALLN